MTRAPRHPPGRLLGANRDFTLLWTGTAISALGSTTSLITYPLLILAVTGSPGLVGLTMAVSMVVRLAVGLPAGVLVDWVDKRRLLLGCDLGRLIAQAGIAAGVLDGRLGLGWIMAAAAIEGCLSTVAGAAEPVAVRQIVDAERLPLALARNEARGAAAMLAGPPLGGLLFGVAPWLPFLFDSVTYLVSFGCVAFIRAPMSGTATGQRTKLDHAMREGLRWIWSQPFLRVTLLLISGNNLVTNSLLLLAIVVSNQRGDAEVSTGMLVAIASVGTMLGALLAPRLVYRLSIRAILILNRALWTALLPLFLFAPNAYALGGLMAVMMLLGPTGNAAVTTGQMRTTPDKLQGRVASARGFCVGLAGPIGTGLIGYGLDQFELGVSVAALTGWMVLMTAIAFASKALRTEGSS